MARISIQEAGSAKLLALIDTIAYSEIGVALLLATDDGYNVLVGATPTNPLIFSDYSHHPRVLNTQLDSTAAGRYQIIWPTWAWLLSEHGYTDFGPENQDRACIALINSRGAYDTILAGDIEQALHLCRSEWASLPDAGYGQHENKMANLVNYYKGVLQGYVQ